jgi:hypothetical protein
MATVAKGYDLESAWRVVGEACRDVGYYLAAGRLVSRPARGGGQAPYARFAKGEPTGSVRCCRYGTDKSTAHLGKTCRGYTAGKLGRLQDQWQPRR